MAIRIDINALGEDIRKILQRVGIGKSRVIFEESGKPLATAVPPWEAESWDENRKKLISLLKRVRTRAKDVPMEELEREIQEAIEAVRR